jgi:hypothetical protein
LGVGQIAALSLAHMMTPAPKPLEPGEAAVAIETGLILETLVAT